MADMFAPLVAQLKANPKTIVFTEGNDPQGRLRHQGSGP